MKKILLLALVMIGGVMQVSAYNGDMWLRCGGLTGGSWDDNNFQFEKSYDPVAGQDVYTLTIGSDKLQSGTDFYFRLFRDNSPAANTETGPYNHEDYTYKFKDGGQSETYSAKGNSDFEGRNGAFKIEHSKIGASSYIITVYLKYNSTWEYYIKVDIVDKAFFISSEGHNYASYVTKNKLDFSGNDNITPYIAKGFNNDKSGIVISSLDVVPANTPIIVKTSDQGISVPTTSNDAEDVSSNALVAGDGATAWDGTDGYTYYYIANDEFHKATSGTLQSYRAYLKVSNSDVPSSSARLSFVVDDEATVIDKLFHERNTDDSFFNLNGQRVETPKSGLYIVNGKKCIIK